jgi:hypothetical protein
MYLQKFGSANRNPQIAKIYGPQIANLLITTFREVMLILK